MKTTVLTLFSAFFIAFSAFAKKDASLLIVTGGHEYEEAEFYRMFDALDGVKYVHMEQPFVQNFYSAKALKPYDVVVFYDMWETITEEAAQGLLDAVGKGKSVLVFHHAICGYNDWPEFIDMAGGKYVKKPFPDPETGQPVPETAFRIGRTIEVSAVKGNGIVKLDAPFSYTEERYYNMYVKPDVKPILMCAEEGRPAEVVEWENRYGRGTVITLLLGHGESVYANPNIRSILGQTIKYLAKKSR